MRRLPRDDARAEEQESSVVVVLRPALLLEWTPISIEFVFRGMFWEAPLE